MLSEMYIYAQIIIKYTISIYIYNIVGSHLNYVLSDIVNELEKQGKSIDQLEKLVHEVEKKADMIEMGKFILSNSLTTRTIVCKVSIFGANH